MDYTIKSKKLGRAVKFFAPDSGGYIYVDLQGGRPGTLGQQICKGGHLFGDTLECCGSEADFGQKCRGWYRAFLAQRSRG